MSPAFYCVCNAGSIETVWGCFCCKLCYNTVNNDAPCKNRGRKLTSFSPFPSPSPSASSSSSSSTLPCLHYFATWTVETPLFTLKNSGPTLPLLLLLLLHFHVSTVLLHEQWRLHCSRWRTVGCSSLTTAQGRRLFPFPFSFFFFFCTSPCLHRSASWTVESSSIVNGSDRVRPKPKCIELGLSQT